MPELIVHIGAGKTGSTSIQFSLRDAAGPLLAGQGFAYVGLMLERVPGARRHDWCAEGAPQKFFQAADKQRTDDEVYQVISAELKRQEARGVKHVIWSNEAFLVQNRRIIPILQRLKDDGVPIRLIAYVRRHDKRAKSAYVEFGLKSKRNRGDLRKFREWAEHHPLSYGEHLAPWQAAFPGALELYNFDAVADVAAHFCQQLGLEGVTPVRANTAPENAMLAAWAVYNGSRAEPTWANDFRRMAVPLKLHDFSTRPVPPLSELLPSQADLQMIQDRCHDDFDQVNALLAEQGQPPLVFDAAEVTPAEVAPWEIERMLLRMVYALQEQVLRLQRQVKALQDQVEDGAADAGGEG